MIVSILRECEERNKREGPPAPIFAYPNLAQPERLRQLLMEIIPLPSQLGSLLTARIGSTPLIGRLEPGPRQGGMTLLARAEWVNPAGSVKARATYSIVADVRRRGLLDPGKVLLDATSGNSGIAFAM